MVKTSGWIGFSFVLVLFLTASCDQRKPSREGVQMGIVGTTLNLLSEDLRPLLSTGALTNIDQLRQEYSRAFPHRPPLFYAETFEPVVLRKSEYQLPLRDYFWLREWTTNDPFSTPLFWSSFHQPMNSVSYLTIEGSERVCPIKDFLILVAPLSNRVERANLATNDLHVQ